MELKIAAISRDWKDKFTASELTYAASAMGHDCRFQELEDSGSDQVVMFVHNNEHAELTQEVMKKFWHAYGMELSHIWEGTSLEDIEQQLDKHMDIERLED